MVVSSDPDNCIFDCSWPLTRPLATLAPPTGEGVTSNLTEAAKFTKQSNFCSPSPRGAGRGSQRVRGREVSHSASRRYEVDTLFEVLLQIGAAGEDMLGHRFSGLFGAALS